MGHVNLASPKIGARVLILHGWDDPMAPPEAMLALATELSEAGADWQVHALKSPAGPEKYSAMVLAAGWISETLRKKPVVTRIIDWYGEKRDQHKHFAYGIAAGRELAPDGEQKLREVADSTHPGEKWWAGRGPVLINRTEEELEDSRFIPFGHVQRIVTGGEGVIGNIHVVKITKGAPHVHTGYDEVYYFAPPPREGDSDDRLRRFLAPSRQNAQRAQAGVVQAVGAADMAGNQADGVVAHLVHHHDPLGHVHDGMMVNLRADNAKLRARAARIVSTICVQASRPSVFVFHRSDFSQTGSVSRTLCM